MTKKKRYKRYSPEFKREALMRASEEGVTDVIVCEELDISARPSPSLHRLRLGSVRLLPQYYEKTPTSLASSAYLAVPRTADRVLEFAPIDATRHAAGPGYFFNVAQR